MLNYSKCIGNRCELVVYTWKKYYLEKKVQAVRTKLEHISI